MLKLLDIIGLSEVKLGKYKVHFATGKKSNPLSEYFSGAFKEWQEHQNNKNFNCDNVLALIHLYRDKWLFAGIYQINGYKKIYSQEKPWYKYNTIEVNGLDHLSGKVVVAFDRKFRNSYVRGEKYGHLLMVSEIKPEKMTIEDFPGYNSVSIGMDKLRTIIRQDHKSWKTALINVAGIYLISDTHNGKLYVGSAYGKQGIWQRWCCYAKTGHGGNKELKQVLKKNSLARARDFKFAVLEVIDINANKQHVLDRENYWKNVLLSREYGYNLS